MHGKNILDLTGKLAAEFPGRKTGRRSTERCAHKIAECLEAVKGVRSVKVETFVCHPSAFFSWCKLSTAAYLISAVLLITHHPFAGLLVLLAAVGFTVTVFGIHDDFFDRFFPSEIGSNVVAEIEPSGEVKQQVVISAHHDAAPVFRPLEHNPRLYPWLLRGAVAVFALQVLIALISCFVLLPGWLYYLVLVAVIFMAPLTFLTGSAVSPGVGDNLVSSCMLVELARELTGKPLKHTKVILASFDAEEYGMRGSAAFLKRHSLAELPSKAIVVDSIYRRQDLSVFTKDLNGTVPLSNDLAMDLLLLQPMKRCVMPPGGGATDAANFAGAGIPAVTVTAMETNPANWPVDFPYHTSRDTISAVEESAVDAIFDLIINYLRK